MNQRSTEMKEDIKLGLLLFALICIYLMFFSPSAL